MPVIPLKTLAVHLRPQDNIAVAAKPIPAGTEVQIDGRPVVVPGMVKLGHKFAVVKIKEGDPILKFGQIIGFAAKDIGVGEHVHVHNVKLGTFQRDYAYATEIPTPPGEPSQYRTFMGYDRGPDRAAHQRYGTRNFIAIISTVTCSAATSCSSLALWVETVKSST